MVALSLITTEAGSIGIAVVINLLHTLYNPQIKTILALENFHLNISALPYITLLAFLFGSTLIASRFSVGQFSPTTYIGIRLIIASLCHILVYALGPRRRWPAGKRLWLNVALLGVFGTAVPMTFIVTSLLYQSSGVTSVLLTVGPAVTVVVAHFFLVDERLMSRKITGVAFAIGGALLIAVRGETGLPEMAEANPIGYALVLSAMIFGGTGIVYARKYLRQYDAFDVASIRMFAAAAVVMPLSLIIIGFDLSRVTASGYFALGYASLVGTFSGMMLAFYIVKRFGATATAMSSNIIPVVAAAGGVLVLDETITSGMIAGMILITVGVILVNERAKNHRG